MAITNVIQILIAIIGIIVTILVGAVVLTEMNNEYKIAEGFCIDKEGIQNVSRYDNFLNYDIINSKLNNDKYKAPVFFCGMDIA